MSSSPKDCDPLLNLLGCIVIIVLINQEILAIQKKKILTEFVAFCHTSILLHKKKHCSLQKLKSLNVAVFTAMTKAYKQTKI